MQRAPDPQLIHELLKRRLEFRRVELVVVVRPPGVMESAISEIKPHVSDRRSGYILLRVRVGIEQPRFLVRSGAQNKFDGIAGTLQMVYLAETRQIQQFLMQREMTVDPAGQGVLREP